MKFFKQKSSVFFLFLFLFYFLLYLTYILQQQTKELSEKQIKMLRILKKTTLNFFSPNCHINCFVTATCSELTQIVQQLTSFQFSHLTFNKNKVSFL